MPTQCISGGRKSFHETSSGTEIRTCDWNPNIKVGTDYLVSDGRNKYSVPFDLIGEKVDIRLTSTTVEVFFHGSRVASHVRKAAAQREPIVNANHMSDIGTDPVRFLSLSESD